MVALSRIFAEPELLAHVVHERQVALDLLLQRGRTFTVAAKEAGLDICPYDSGFFVIANCNDPDGVSEELFKDGIFTVPFDGRGLRISIASISEEWCKVIPGKIVEAIHRKEAVK